MEDSKELIIIKILSELQEKYEINNLDVKEILERNLNNYTLVSNETTLMASDLPEKIMFFLGLKSLEGLSKKSINRYEDELRMFSRYVIKPVAQIDINDLRRYFAMIQSERSYEKSTINGKMSVLKVFSELFIKKKSLLKTLL